MVSILCWCQLCIIGESYSAQKPTVRKCHWAFVERTVYFVHSNENVQPSPAQPKRQNKQTIPAQCNHHTQLHCIRVSRKFQQDSIPVLCTCMQWWNPIQIDNFSFLLYFQLFLERCELELYSFSPCHWCERKCIFPQTLPSNKWCECKILVVFRRLTSSFHRTNDVNETSNTCNVSNAYCVFNATELELSDYNHKSLQFFPSKGWCESYSPGNKHTCYPSETLNILQNTMLNLAACNLSALENNFNWAWIFFFAVWVNLTAGANMF